VPVDGLPPTTDVGLSVTPVTIGAVTASEALWVPFAVAVIEAVWLVATATVLTVNVPEVEPGAIVAVASTVAAALLDERATERPLAGAALPIVIVPIELVPPTTVVGLRDTAVTPGAVRFKVAVAVPVVAEIVSASLAATARVVT